MLQGGCQHLGQAIHSPCAVRPPGKQDKKAPHCPLQGDRPPWLCAGRCLCLLGPKKLLLHFGQGTAPLPWATLPRPPPLMPSPRPTSFSCPIWKVTVCTRPPYLAGIHGLSYKDPNLSLRAEGPGCTRGHRGVFPGPGAPAASILYPVFPCRFWEKKGLASGDWAANTREVWVNKLERGLMST